MQAAMQAIVDAALGNLPTYAGYMLPVLALVIGLIVASWGASWIRGR